MTSYVSTGCSTRMGKLVGSSRSPCSAGREKCSGAKLIWGMFCFGAGMLPFQRI